MKKLLLLPSLLLLSLGLSAQVSHGGHPRLMGGKALVKSVTLPTVDNQALLQEDIAGTGGALRLGVMQPADIELAFDGLSCLVISSPGATFMALYFDLYDLREGDSLFVYNDAGFCIGAFTQDNRQPDGTFWTQTLPGDRVTVECHGQGRVHINRVLHGYKPFNGYNPDSKERMGSSGDCNINVICPLADPYRDQVRSVVCLVLATEKGGFFCSGALVNNTAQDKTPYVLCAYHCQDLPDPLVGITFFFNYQTTSCEDNFQGPNDQTVIGAEIVAKETADGGSDMLLLRLQNPIPDDYEPYYAGWDRSAEVPSIQGNFALHHPAGDFKKVSIPYSVRMCLIDFIINKHDGTYYTADGRKFLRVEWANQGIIEGGSSGSPLFNKDKRIVGQLSAGSGDCDSPEPVAFYGRFASDWDGLEGSTPATRLRDWLDPLGTGAKSIDGINWDATVRPYAAPEAEVLPVFPNPSNGMVHFSVDEIGDATYTIHNSFGRLLYEGSTVLATNHQALNLTFLPNGAYVIHLTIGEKHYANTILIQK